MMTRNDVRLERASLSRIENAHIVTEFLSKVLRLKEEVATDVV